MAGLDQTAEKNLHAEADLTLGFETPIGSRIEQIASILGLSPSMFLADHPTQDDETPPSRDQIAAFTASDEGINLIRHIMAIRNADIRHRLLKIIIQLNGFRAG